MRFPAGFLDEIRNRLPCSSVVARKVQLRKQGREFVGLSPFNSEKTPSFFVNDQKAAWFDHSAGKNGDIFGFLMESEGLSFPDAVSRLAEQAGVPMPKADAETVRREARKAELVEILEAANEIFKRCLAQQRMGPAGVEEGSAAGYIGRRGISEAETDQFEIGYAPNERSFLKQRLSESFGQDAVAEAGLLIHGDDVPVSYDRFRGRIMFPIRDQKGRLVGFGGRVLDPTATPKYLNCPETLTFDKGRLLYNANKAHQPAWDGAPVIVTEGYTATIASVRAGYSASVATMGTALGEPHLESLWRMSDEPIVCFDGDPAGKRAARRVLETALPMLLPGRSLRFATLPGGLDPDDVVTKRGPDAFRGYIESAAPMFDFLWRSTVEGRALATPDARAKLRGDLENLIDKIPNQDLRREYLSDARDRVNEMPKRTPVNRSNGASNHSTSPSSIRLVNGYSRRRGLTLRDAMIVSAMVASPAAAHEAMESLPVETLSPEAQGAVRAIYEALAAVPEADSEALLLALDGVRSTIAEAQTICHDSGIRSLEPGSDASARTVLSEAIH